MTGHHQPTPEQLDRLKSAWLAHANAAADTAQARADLAQAIAHEAEANAELSRAITDVLYGPQEDSEARRVPDR